MEGSVREGRGKGKGKENGRTLAEKPMNVPVETKNFLKVTLK